MTMNVREWLSVDELRAQATGMMPAGGGQGTLARPGASSMQQDDTDQQQDPQNMQDPDLQAAPYVKLLGKLGYEFQGADEDVNGAPIGQSFQGPDGDSIIVKTDGSWIRFGPGSQRSQGPDVNSLGQNLVRGALAQGDDTNHNAALRQAGYSKIHKDAQGNTYYKHPQSGRTVTVGKDGRWGSSAGTGRGATKLQGFLGNESMQDQDPQMQKMKMQQQQMKMQQQQQKQVGGPARSGTRGAPGTRPAGRF